MKKNFPENEINTRYQNIANPSGVSSVSLLIQIQHLNILSRTV